MTTKFNSLVLTPGAKRIGIKVDEMVWSAIKRASKEKKMKWSEWAREVILANPDAANRNEALRSAAISDLLKILMKVELELELSGRLKTLLGKAAA